MPGGLYQHSQSMRSDIELVSAGAEESRWNLRAADVYAGASAARTRKYVLPARNRRQRRPMHAAERTRSLDRQEAIWPLRCPDRMSLCNCRHQQWSRDLYRPAFRRRQPQSRPAHGLASRTAYGGLDVWTHTILKH